MKFYKYPSIEAYRNIIKAVQSQHDYQGKDENGDNIYQHISPYPTLSFTGTVKLHGTNSGIIKHKDGTVTFQSRERILTLQYDNAGFAAAMLGCNLDFLFEGVEFEEYIAVYGEWCGGNIQAGIALNQLPKMFVIFGLKIDGEWKQLPADLHSNEQRIYNIYQFPTYEIDIDFNVPELVQNKLIEMTLEVEKECPIGAYFGVSGVGEGLVFTSNTNPDFRFKSKGEKHSASKVKTLNTVNVEEIEGLNEFVEYAASENRLKQGLTYLQENGFPLSVKSTGDFIRWVVNDVYKEESDTIVANKLEVKKVNSAISVKARMWFLNNI